MSYDTDGNSSWDKIERQQGKQHKKDMVHQEGHLDLNMIPDSYLGNEDLWDDISEELEELYGK